MLSSEIQIDGEPPSFRSMFVASMISGLGLEATLRVSSTDELYSGIILHPTLNPVGLSTVDSGFTLCPNIIVNSPHDAFWLCISRSIFLLSA